MQEEMVYNILKREIIIEALVTSNSLKGAYYRVDYHEGDWQCSCPDFQMRKSQTDNHCKHILFLRGKITL
jgi:hypothetical protein